MQKKVFLQVFLLFLILAISFIIRIRLFDYPLQNGESVRDYIVGYHIVQYHEFPLTGHASGIFSPLKNSPLYYYVIAGIVAIKDNFLFLGYVNILLQLAVIACIYILGKHLFSATTGLIAAALYGLAQSTISVSLYPWHPHIMSPFLHLSFIFLMLGYTKKNYFFMLLSSFMFSFSASLHTSVISILPLFFIVTIAILKSQGKPVQYFFPPIVLALASYLLFNLSVYIYYRGESPDIFGIIGEKIIHSPGEIIQNFISNTFMIVGDFFYVSRYASLFQPPFSKNEVAFLLFLIAFAFYFVNKKIKAIKKIHYAVVVLFLLVPIFFASILEVRIFDNYFIGFLGLVTIIIAEAIHGVFSGHLTLNTIKIIIVLLILGVSSRNFYYPEQHQDLVKVNSAVAAMEKEVIELQRKENFEDWTFFKIKIYKKNSDIDNALFWAPLEKSFDYPFTKVSSGDGGNLTATNSDEYIFLVCNFSFGKFTNNMCKESFLQENPYHKIEKEIFSQDVLSIYLTKKVEVE